jgi:type IV secretion system protein VirD4
MLSKSRLIIFLLLLLILLIVLPILSSAFTQFIDTYKFNLSLVPDNLLTAILKTPSTYIKFFSQTTPPNILSWSIIALFTIYSLLGLLSSKSQKRYMQRDSYGSHGTSRFQTPTEIKKNYFKYNTGWFLGSDKPNISYSIGMNGAYLPLQGSLSMQIAVFGSPGSYKTTSFVLPNIFHIPFIYKDTPQKTDLIITDPKCELFRLTNRYLKN